MLSTCGKDHETMLVSEGRGQGKVRRDGVESNSQSSQREPYLKVPPASFSGNPLLPDHYGTGGGGKTSFHKIIYTLWIEMTNSWTAVTFLRVNYKRRGHPRWWEIITLLL